MPGARFHVGNRGVGQATAPRGLPRQAELTASYRVEKAARLAQKRNTENVKTDADYQRDIHDNTHERVPEIASWAPRGTVISELRSIVREHALRPQKNL